MEKDSSLQKTVGSVKSTLKAKEALLKPVRGVLIENKNVLNTKWCNGLYIQFRHSFAKETFS